jgi:hypothetical protein
MSVHKIHSTLRQLQQRGSHLCSQLNVIYELGLVVAIVLATIASRLALQLLRYETCLSIASLIRQLYQVHVHEHEHELQQVHAMFQNVDNGKGKSFIPELQHSLPG